jgi:hypothetical protein
VPDTDALHRRAKRFDVEALEGGWTLHEIGNLFDRPHTSIHNILSKTGGNRPPERRRCATAPPLAER